MKKSVKFYMILLVCLFILISCGSQKHEFTIHFNDGELQKVCGTTIVEGTTYLGVFIERPVHNLLVAVFPKDDVNYITSIPVLDCERK